MNVDRAAYFLRGVGLSALVAFCVFALPPACRWMERNGAAMERARFSAVEARLHEQLRRHHGTTATVTCTLGGVGFVCVARAGAETQYFQCSVYAEQLCVPAIGGAR